MTHSQTLTNFNLQELRLEKELDAHRSYVNCICLIDQTRFASCGNDNVIKLWNSNTYHCLADLKGHTNNVLYISLLTNGSLASCGRDNVIKIWNINDKKCLFTLSYHQDWVWKIIEISGNRICTSSSDKTLAVFDNSPPYRIKRILKGHRASVFSLIELINEKCIVSSSSLSNELIVWDSNTYQTQTVLRNVDCSGGRNSLLKVDDAIIVGCYKSIVVFDTLTFRVRITVRFDRIGNISYISSFNQMSDGLILCGTNEGALIEVNINKNESIRSTWDGNNTNKNIFVSNSTSGIIIKENSHSARVNSLILMNDDTLISCSEDGTIKIWK